MVLRAAFSDRTKPPSAWNFTFYNQEGFLPRREAHEGSPALPAVPRPQLSHRQATPCPTLHCSALLGPCSLHHPPAHSVGLWSLVRTQAHTLPEQGAPDGAVTWYPASWGKRR